MPVSWNYQSTLIECGTFYVILGKFTIPLPLTVITFVVPFQYPNKASNKFVLGFIDLDYSIVIASNGQAIRTYYNGGTKTMFNFTVMNNFNNALLSRFSINYLAISLNFNEFFICIAKDAAVISR